MLVPSSSLRSADPSFFLRIPGFYLAQPLYLVEKASEFIIRAARTAWVDW